MKVSLWLRKIFCVGLFLKLRLESWVGLCMAWEGQHVLNGAIEGIKNAVSGESRVFWRVLIRMNYFTVILPCMRPKCPGKEQR